MRPPSTTPRYTPLTGPVYKLRQLAGLLPSRVRLQALPPRQSTLRDTLHDQSGSEAKSRDRAIIWEGEIRELDYGISFHHHQHRCSIPLWCYLLTDTVPLLTNGSHCNWSPRSARRSPSGISRPGVSEDRGLSCLGVFWLLACDHLGWSCDLWLFYLASRPALALLQIVWF